MGPRRQVPRPNKAKAATKQADRNNDSLDDPIPPSSSMKAQDVDSDSISLTPSRSTRPASVLSLSLSRKSTASTQVARESILGEPSKNGQRAADFSRFEHKRLDAPTALSDDRPAVMKNMGKTRSDVQAAVPEVDDASRDDSSDFGSKDTRGVDNDQVKDSTKDLVHDDTPSVDVVTSAQVVNISTVIEWPDTQKTDVPTTPGWLGWLGYSATAPLRSTKGANSDSGGENANISSATTVEEGEPNPEPVDIKVATSNDTKDGDLSPVANDKAKDNITHDTATEPIPDSANRGSWFGLWPAAVTASVAQPIAAAEQSNSSASLQPKSDASDTPTAPEKASETTTSESGKSSSWGFWSKQSPATTQSHHEVSDVGGERGELAIKDTPSQNQPEAATIKQSPAPSTPEPKKSSKKAETKGKLNAFAAQDDSGTVPKDFFTANSPATPVTPSSASPPNLLLPSFKGTFKLKDNPTILEQITQLILMSKQKPTNQVYLLKEPPRIKKALAIGIHGLFPAQILRSVIGQPTGTSIRFATHAATAIQKWTDAHGHECEIEKVALEGEGKISDRVDSLWKLLLNWVDHVRSSDFILIACHSQGVPVALMLIAKLLDFDVVSSAKIGVCAMAGVSLGPFVEYKSNVRSLLGGSTAELFEFANPESDVSKRYEAALRQALSYGVRVTYVGSLDDQLVSLESAIYSPANHPYIYRAVFVDGRVHAPDFICHLVGFALKLRNLGISDHGLIRELSAPLAGSLYSGGGHSSLYHETEIYDLAVAFALETSDVDKTDLVIQRAMTSGNNPYQLPWSLRGLLEEDVAKTSLGSEVRELLRQFDDWKPLTKPLKDVKYRLEAVRGLL